MIWVNTTQGWQECNVCYSKDNLLEIIFRGNESNNGTAVVLCEKCRKELCERFNEKGGESNG